MGIVCVSESEYAFGIKGTRVNGIFLMVHEGVSLLFIPIFDR